MLGVHGVLSVAVPPIVTPRSGVGNVTRARRQMRSRRPASWVMLEIWM
jgi:hypothetical protein